MTTAVASSCLLLQLAVPIGMLGLSLRLTSERLLRCCCLGGIGISLGNSALLAWMLMSLPAGEVLSGTQSLPALSVELLAPLTIFLRVAWRLESATVPWLFLPPLLVLTSMFLRPLSQADSAETVDTSGLLRQRTSDTQRFWFGLSLVWLGMTWLICANDLVSFLCAALFVTTGLGLLSARENSRSNWRVTFAAWVAIAAGLLWLAATASLVRSAPHAPPGETTLVLSEIFELIHLSSHQHPAAQFVWEQYQRLPWLTLLLGLGLLGGWIPLHGFWLSNFEQSADVEALWRLLLSKFSLFLIYRWMIAPDAENWALFAGEGEHLVLLGLVYASCLVFADGRRSRKVTEQQVSLSGLGLLAIWSQHLALLALFLIPAQGTLILWMLSLMQFPALVLIAIGTRMTPLLRKDFFVEIPGVHKQTNPASTGLCGSSRNLLTLWGCLGVGLLPSFTGLVLLWELLLDFIMSPTWSALKLLLFVLSLVLGGVACLQQVSRQALFKQTELSSELPESGVPTASEIEFTLLCLLWWGIQLVGMLGGPLFLSR